MTVGWFVALGLGLMWLRERARRRRLRRTHQPRALFLVPAVERAEPDTRPPPTSMPGPPWARDIPMPVPPKWRRD